MDWPNIILLILQRNRRLDSNNFGGLFLLVKTFFFSGSLGNYPNHLPIAVYVLSTMNYIYSQAFMFSPLQELILYFRSISNSVRLKQHVADLVSKRSTLQVSFNIHKLKLWKR